MTAVWIAFSLFMHLRARNNRGVFLYEEIELFAWLGTAGFIAGLLFVSIYYVTFG